MWPTWPGFCKSACAEVLDCPFCRNLKGTSASSCRAQFELYEQHILGLTDGIMIRGQVWLPKATIVADTATVRVFLECFTTQNGIIHSYLGKVSQDTDDLVEAIYWFLLATHQLQLDKIYKDRVGARKGWIYAASSPATSAARNDKGWKLQEDLHSHMCNEPWCPSGIAADKVSCT